MSVSVALELVTPLPPGAPSHTRLAKHGARLVVLREILDGTDCSWPPASPKLVTLQEVGELQGKRHALFDWVPGVTLRDLLQALEQQGNPLPLGLVAHVLVDAARALDAINPARPHGGLQDAALQIGFDGQVWVLDFGAPRVSRFRPLGRVNFAADVFALGGVLHAALTGFQGEYATPPATLATPSNSHPEATPAIDDVVARALSAQPDSRQADAGSFADELEVVVGEAMFTTAQVAEVVRTLFSDRIRLLQSLGGLVDANPGPSLEAVLPVGIPQGTQPGFGGPPPARALAHPEPPSEPTLPRVVSKEVLVSRPPSPPVGPSIADVVEPTMPRIPLPTAVLPPRPEVPWDSAEGLEASGPGSEPTLPRVVSSEVVPRVSEPPRKPAPPRDTRDDDDEADADGKTTSVDPAALAAASDLGRPRASAPPRKPVRTAVEPPDDTNPRAKIDPQEDTGPRAKFDAHGDTNPRAKFDPQEDTGPRAKFDAHEDTNPRAKPDLPEDTSPRAKIDLPEDTAPRARSPLRPADSREATGPTPQMPPRPRNTTEAERHRARGQERLRTPPEGTPALGEAELNEPTAVRAKPKPDPKQVAQTAQTLPPVPGAESSGGGGLRVVMVVLLLVVVGLAGAVVVKAQRAQQRPVAVEDLGEVVDLVEDAGAVVTTTPDAGAPALVTAALDAGAADVPEVVIDAGAPPPTIEAGPPDAGVKAAKKAVKKPVKKVVKKKKR